MDKVILEAKKHNSPFNEDVEGALNIFKNLCVTTKDGQRIFYDHYKKGSDKVVIIAHGFFNSKNAVLLKDLGQEMLREGYDVIIMDFRGHGESPGLFYWTAKEHLDLEAVLDFAKQSYHKVSVIGFSLGAASSIITASRTTDIHGLILVSPPISFSEIEFYFWECNIEHEILYTTIGEGRLGKGVRPGPMWLRKDKPIDCINKVKCPTLFIHGDIDWVIRHRHSVALFEKAKCEKKLIIIREGPHAEYLMQRKRAEILTPIKEWLLQTF